MSTIKSIMRAVKRPSKIVTALGYRDMLKFLPDSIYLKSVYREMMGRKLDLNNPQTFNEKLQWLKIYDRNSRYTNLADKYEVRNYIKETVGEEYLVPLLGVYNSFDEIDFSLLSNEFVLKCIHD